MPSISGIFDTRREAEMAIEHLVQDHGVDRAAVAVTAAGSDNSAGIEVAGSDAKRNDPHDDRAVEAALNGRIMVTVDADAEAPIEAIFREFKAAGIRTGTGAPPTDSGQS